ncbi:MAG TPA: DUF3048 domain-containing protein [Feifaniaceae bacterium]|nr:DUF3048 domain-containing protein [Feifaniaceae bacterium]
MDSAQNNHIRRTIRRLNIALAALAALALFSGCSVAETLLDVTGNPETTPSEENLVVIADTKAPSDDSSSEEQAEEADQSSASDTPAPTGTPAPNVSFTTGRELPEGFVYRPVLAVIDNAAQSRPQTALMLADVVYEFPLDRTDHTTRYLAVFSDVIPERVGPIRDSRAYLAQTALEWDGLYVSAGDPTELREGYPVLSDAGLRFRAENSGSAASYFYTDKTVTAIEEHTLFFKAREYAETNFTADVAASAERFTFESGVSYEKSKGFISVGIPFTSSDQERVLFTYDEKTNLLTRSDKNSKNVPGISKSLTPTDSALGYESVPITVQNLIVQFVYATSFDTLYRAIDVVGDGDCYFFINGQCIIGSWSRPTLDDVTTYKAYDGTVVRLEPGNTWIEMTPISKAIKIRYTG